MRATIRELWLFLISLLLLFFLGIAWIFYLTLKKGPPLQEAREEEQIIHQETEDPPQVNGEEVISRAQEAILLAKHVIAQAEQFLLEYEEKKKGVQVAEIRPRIPDGSEKMEQKTEQGNPDFAKGIYMTALLATGKSKSATEKRQQLVDLILETELNAIVIDVKEAEGPYPLSLYRDLVEELKAKGIWTIARIVVFADASMVGEHPEWYCKTKTGTLWQDLGSRYWLDPGNRQAQEYLISFSKNVIDAGFDELQFDYIRFPSEGDLSNLVCPASQGEKSEIIEAFTAGLTSDLRAYHSDIVLSADLFGLLAVKREIPAIGQRVADFAKTFDYISFMLYPSHFYGGFEVPADQTRNLPALYFPYESADVSRIVSAHPYEVVWRSLLFASDYLTSMNSPVKLRPWIQDFSLKADTQRGIIYDAEKVKLQIRAAEDAGLSGWLLWNPLNTYTTEALKDKK